MTIPDFIRDFLTNNSLTDDNFNITTLNHNLHRILNKLAPITSKTILLTTNTKWFNSILRNTKILLRAAERKWRK